MGSVVRDRHLIQLLYIIDNATEKVYVMLEDRLTALFKQPEEYTILERMVGSSLVGKKYKPLFDYFAHLKTDEPNKGAFRIVRWASF